MNWSRLLLLAFLVAATACVGVEVRQPPPKPTVLATTRYAGPAGGGSAPCTTNSAPYCLPATALAQLACGDTLILKSGTYTGTNGMLSSGFPTSAALTCSSGSKMTVQAEVDGGPIFDGQYGRDPCVFWGFTYWNLSGFNCIHPLHTSMLVRDSHFVEVKRVVAVDGNGHTNDPTIQMWDAADILLEDVAAFGLAKKQLDEWSSGMARVTYRRVWFRTEGGASEQFAIQSNYTQPDHPTPSLFENAIFVLAPNTREPSFDYGPPWGVNDAVPHTLFDVRHNALSPYVRFLGSLGYPTTDYTPWISGHLFEPSASPPNTVSGFILQDVLLHTNGKPTVSPVYIGTGLEEGTLRLQQLTRVTTVGPGGTYASSIHPSTTITPAGSFKEATTLAATGFDWLGGSNTARLCKRYVAGIYQDGSGGSTNTPLWPWPMDNRIKAAIAANTVANGAAGANSYPLAGSLGPGYAAGTVTSEVVSVLGSAIPSACNAAATSTTPNPPAGLTLTQLWRAPWTPLAGWRK